MLRDEIREQRKKLKGRSLKEKLEWFIEYDLFPTVLIGGLSLLAICVIVTMVTGKDQAFGAMFINASLSDDQAEILEEDFAEYAGIDLGKYDVFMDLDESHSISEDESYYDVYSTEAIMTRLMAGQADVMVADAYMFAQYAEYGYMLDLTEVLTEEQLEEYRDRLYYVDQALIDAEEDTSEEEASQEENSAEEDTAEADESGGGDSGETEDDGTEEEASEDTSYSDDDSELYNSILIENFEYPDPSAMEDPIPVGIVVNDAPYILENHNYDDITCIFGVVANVDDPTYALMFLDYLFENEQETR